MAPCEPSGSRGMRHLAHIPKVQEVEGERKRGRKERRGKGEEGRRGKRGREEEKQTVRESLSLARSIPATQYCPMTHFLQVDSTTERVYSVFVTFSVAVTASWSRSNLEGKRFA